MQEQIGKNDDDGGGSSGGDSERIFALLLITTRREMLSQSTHYFSVLDEFRVEDRKRRVGVGDTDKGMNQYKPRSQK